MVTHVSEVSVNLAPPSKQTGDCSTQVEQETYPRDSISPEDGGVTGREPEGAGRG